MRGKRIHIAVSRYDVYEVNSLFIVASLLLHRIAASQAEASFLRNR